MLPEPFRVNCVLILIICINGFDIKISAKPRRKSHVTWHLNKNSHKPIKNLGPFDVSEGKINNKNKVIQHALQVKSATIGDDVTISYQNNNYYLESEDDLLINDETNIVAPMRPMMLPPLEFREEPSLKRGVGPLVQSLMAPFAEEFVKPLLQHRITYNTLQRGIEPSSISPLRDFYRLNNDFAHTGLFSIDIVDAPKKVIPRKQYNVVYNKIDMNNVLPYRKQMIKKGNIDIRNELVIPNELAEKELLPEKEVKFLYRGPHGKPVESITIPPKKLYVIIEDFPGKPKRQTKRKQTRDGHRQKKAPSLLDFNAFSLAKVSRQKHKLKPSGTHDEDDKSVALDLFKKVRVLCWVLTHPPNHNITTKPIRQTWGRRCNKLLFISSVEDDDTPPVRANEEGPEHVWPKVKAAFMYVYNHHRNDAEWFLRADDDTYVIMENLRYMLSDYNSGDPLYFGCRVMEGNSFTESNYMNGGAGVILSKNAIDRLMNTGFFGAQLCRNSEESDFNADLKLGICLHRVGVKAMDTRDAEKKLRFMPLPAQDIVAPKDAMTANDSYWRRTLHQPKVGLSCCSDFAISFHYVTPKNMYALEYLIYHVRPFGIKFGEAGMPGLLLNNTEPRLEINALPKIPENPFQLKNMDEYQLYSKHRKDLADERNVLLVQRNADEKESVKDLKIVWNARDTAFQDKENTLPKKKTVKIKPVVTSPNLDLDVILDESTKNLLSSSSDNKTKKEHMSITKYKYDIDYNTDQDNAEYKYTKDDTENEKYRLEEYQESVAENRKSNTPDEVYTEEYYKLTDLVGNDTNSKTENMKKDNNKGNKYGNKRVKKILPKSKTRSKSKRKEAKYKHRVLHYEYIDPESTTNMKYLIARSTEKLSLSERYFKEQLSDGVFEYSFNQKNLVVREMSDPETSPKKIKVNTKKVDVTKNKKHLDADDEIEEKIEKIRLGNKTTSLDNIEWITSNNIESSLNKFNDSDKDTLVTEKIDEGVLKIVETDKYDQLDEQTESWDDL